jgi:4-carboxymuconolactone decarboxylase
LLVRAPEVCRHLSRLDEYLRWGSSLAPALSELAICLTARSIRANYEWHAHAPLAVEAGVPAAALEAIRTGAAPHFPAKDQALVYRIVTELIETKRLSDASFAEAIAAFGEQGVVELGTIIGYYTAIGNALNVFEVGLPAGTAPYFPE